jgi:hypothetical protein
MASGHGTQEIAQEAVHLLISCGEFQSLVYFRFAVNAQQLDHVRCSKDAARMQQGRTRVTREPAITLK